MRFVLLALLLLPGAFGATIAGTAYTETLETAQFAILSINTTPQQRMLLSTGIYNLSVPPGTYLLRATLKEDGVRYEDELQITVVDDGTYAYDLILFRAEPNATEEFPDISDITIPDAGPGWRPVALVLLLLFLMGLAFVLSRRRWWQRGTAQPPDTAPGPGEKDDLARIIAIIRDEGGRTTQKELRRHLPYSEAKISMMVAELESEGRVRKIRKGRGNIIVLK